METTIDPCPKLAILHNSSLCPTAQRPSAPPFAGPRPQVRNVITPRRMLVAAPEQQEMTATSRQPRTQRGHLFIRNGGADESLQETCTHLVLRFLYRAAEALLSLRQRALSLLTVADIPRQGRHFNSLPAVIAAWWGGERHVDHATIPCAGDVCGDESIRSRGPITLIGRDEFSGHGIGGSYGCRVGDTDSAAPGRTSWMSAVARSARSCAWGPLPDRMTASRALTTSGSNWVPAAL